ncbi:hypothetical protein EVAR_61906_1 [Eumeta japonica]|uniref:Uncharacterized protein n=1 Tax=Eumeta variegata TaxID=151549 RepID=A0A4C1YJ73_EUMVA|nr:hypothetical protein EVAR_61906_1 [Eumeta japonica]
MVGKGFPRTIQRYPQILHDCRELKRITASEQVNDGASTPAAAAAATEAVQVDYVIASISTLDCLDIDYVRTRIIKDTFSSS